jgi:mono/diheme cytochrome c family protein
MSYIGRLTLVFGLASCLLSLPAQNSTPSTKNSPAEQSHSKPTRVPNRGEQVFQQNCSRCHNAPQGFPPQISASIARHMRVRASLSAADEKALMKFLNP